MKNAGKRFFPVKTERPVSGPLSPGVLRELMLFSAFMFLFAALIHQFLYTMITAGMLRIFAISFTLEPYAILFKSVSSLNWSATRIYMVFGAAPVILTFAGTILFFVTGNLRKTGWKIKLFLTWLTFFFTHSLVFSMAGGTLFFDYFGISYHWIFSQFSLRGLVFLIVIAIMLIFSNRWFRMFMKTACTSHYLDHWDHQRIYIIHTYFKPWLIGTLVLILFSYPFLTPYWPVFYLTSGYLAVRLIDYKHQFHVQIKRSDKVIFRSRWQILVFLLLVVLLRLIGFIRISF